MTGRGVLAVALAVAAVLAVTAATPAAAEQAPANDTVSGATVIGTLPFHASQDVAGATLDDADRAASSRCEAPQQASVWFSLPGGAAGPLEVDTVASAFDTTVSVFLQTDAGLSEVACNDDFGDATSRVRLDVQRDSAYLIRVASMGGVGQLRLRAGAPARFEYGEMRPATARAHLDDGSATVTSTSQCSYPVLLRIDASLEQRDPLTGRRVRADGSETVVCHGPTRWTVRLHPEQGRFAVGEAQVSYVTTVCVGSPPCVGFDTSDTLLMLAATP